MDGGEIEYTAKLSRAAFAAGAGTELGRNRSEGVSKVFEMSREYV